MIIPKVNPYADDEYIFAIHKLKKMEYKIYIQIEEANGYETFDKHIVWIAEKDNKKFKEIDPLRLFGCVMLAEEYSSMSQEEYDEIAVDFKLTPVKE